MPGCHGPVALRYSPVFASAARGTLCPTAGALRGHSVSYAIRTQIRLWRNAVETGRRCPVARRTCSIDTVCCCALLLPSSSSRRWARSTPSPLPFAAPTPDNLPTSVLVIDTRFVAAAALVLLSQVGAFDPITRQPVREEQLVPNTSLRAAIELYLEEHPWAWGEVK